MCLPKADCYTTIEYTNQRGDSSDSFVHFKYANRQASKHLPSEPTKKKKTSTTLIRKAKDTVIKYYQEVTQQAFWYIAI